MTERAVYTLKWMVKEAPTILLWIIWGCVIYNGFNALAEYTNAHGLFPDPWGGLAMAITVDGTLVFAFLSFRRGPSWMAGVLLATAAVTTYTLQRWHAEMVAGQVRAMHPLIVAGIVPGALVLITWAWHLIQLRKPVGTADREVPPRKEPERTERTETPRTTLGPRVQEPIGPKRPTAIGSGTPSASGNGGRPIDRARLVLAEHADSDPPLTVAKAAEMAGVSERTVRNAKAAMAGEPAE